jgi:hypothetical protein
MRLADLPGGARHSRRTVFSKLDLPDRAWAVVGAYEVGLVRPDG